MLNVQNFLLQIVDFDGNSLSALEALKEEFGIKYRIYPEDRMVLLDYDQIESPKSHPIVIECRSLILSYPDFSNVVSRKFDRFFNYGECPEYYHDFDFKDSVVYEKADGSLIGVYFNFETGRWEISTRGMAKAEGPHLFYPTFRDCVLDTFGFQDEAHFQSVFNYVGNYYYTYVFECTGPKNKCVKRYDTPEMVCLGVIYNDVGKAIRNKENEVECLLAGNFGLNVRLPVVYDSTDVDSIVKMVSEFKNLDEGVVVFDPSSNKRIKIKSATYVAAHKLRGNDPVPTTKNLLTVLFEGEVDELLAYFPEFKEYVEPLQAKIAEALAEMMEVWHNVSGIENQKDFALAIKDCKLKNVLFDARKNKTDPLHAFNTLNLNYKLKIFGA